jgi:hypothetical protein
MNPKDKIDISGYRGPIRYDYRFAVDDEFHDARTAWCSGNRLIAVP